MGTNVSNFQNNAKNSNIILTSESNEMEFSKEVKTGSYSITPKDYPSALRALADEIDAKNRAIAERAQAEAERQQAIKTIEEQRPDVEFAESFKKVDHENMWLIRDVAKKLEQNGIIIAEKNLRLFLEEVKFMFRNGQGRWELYSDIVKIGLVCIDYILLTNIPGKELISKPST